MKFAGVPAAPPGLLRRVPFWHPIGTLRAEKLDDSYTFFMISTPRPGLPGGAKIAPFWGGGAASRSCLGRQGCPKTIVLGYPFQHLKKVTPGTPFWAPKRPIN